ncbi:MAG: hypothetical protein FJY67_03380 [Calditrichaeota bacterium]|nr:hypothetical protein [Calditrichota bacterium]
MRYCPKCAESYTLELDVCDDCGADLIDTEPISPLDQIEDNDWVELLTLPGMLYSRMAIELLQREGIPSYSETSSNGAGFLNGSNRGEYIGAKAAIFVLESDLERAREVMSPVLDELPGDDDSDVEEE